MDYIKNHPMVIQIGDIISVNSRDSVFHLKVIALTIEQQRREYQKKVLDISDEKAKDVKGLDCVTVDEVSFNEHYSYLLHSKVLKELEIISNPRGESNLPPHQLRFSGHLKIITKTAYFRDVKNQFRQYMFSSPRE